MSEPFKDRQGLPLAVGDTVAFATLAYKSANLRFGVITEVLEEVRMISKRRSYKEYDREARRYVNRSTTVEEKQHPGVKIAYSTDGGNRSIWQHSWRRGRMVDVIKTAPGPEEAAADV